MQKQAFIILLLGVLGIFCKSERTQNRRHTPAAALRTTTLPDSTLVYKSEHLLIRRLSPHVYQHTSFLSTTEFGKVDCNGMMVVNKAETVVFDTPPDNESSAELIRFVTEKLQSKIKAVIPTHFHEDCVGGLEKFMASGVSTYASKKTVDLLQNNNRHFSKPIQRFDDSLTVTIGDKTVYACYFGEGHTKDNIVGLFPEEKAVFGGCLIKATGAGKGNLADANVSAWPATVSKLREKFPQAAIVIPGHGRWGGPELLDYTILLFK